MASAGQWSLVCRYLGSPAFSMKTALLRLPTAGNPLENGLSHVGRRHCVIESAGEPLSGTKSSTVKRAVLGPMTDTGRTNQLYVT
jgi:hypothetical protein